MKGGIQGLKVSQVSLILIGLVCFTVLAFAWTKTTFLTSFVPSQSRALQLDPDTSAGPRETSGGNNNSVQALTNQIDSLISPGISVRENIENATTDNERGNSPVIERTGSEEVSQKKNKSKQEDIVPENSPTVESSVKSKQIGNSPASTEKKGNSPVIERTGSEEVSQKKNESKQADIVPESSITQESSIKAEQTRNLSAITGKKANVIMPKVNGSWMIIGLYILALVVSNGCRLCGLVAWLSAQILNMKNYVGNLKVVKGTISQVPSSWRGMQDKTLAFVGDSLGRQQFQSLMCMVTGGEERPDVLNVGHEYGLVKARGAIRPDGWAYRFPTTNTTILYYWSASLCDLEPIDSSTNIAMHLDRPPSFLRRFLPKFHVLVLNTGHHWNRGKLDANRWVMYVNGSPNTNRKTLDIAGAKNFTVHSIVKWIDSQLPLYPGLKAFLRSISPRHFFNGDWNTGGTCDNTTPRGKEVVEDESSDPLAAVAVRGTNVKYLDITRLSELRDEGHISRYSIKGTTPEMQDCLHWCLPGIPDTWNEILFAQI
ncbi:hypothetical protein CASFOL_032393 [Castilleja foliolosa]|uniref:Trichome birefringence-like C-terminal domain-containing protein n=1 Tax=Castilleja foliolosa TaxID=1961234 RepID=A0ABD3C1Z1_9LAMI